MWISDAFSKHRVTLLALAIGACAVFAGRTAALPPAAGDSPPVSIASHRALYLFKLAAANPAASINAVRGRMYFEQDDACDAWTTDRRFTTEYQYADDAADTEASRYVAFESKDQRQFSFSSERQENGETTEQLRGSIEVGADGTARAVYARPDGLGYDLPKDYLLPTMHTVELVRRARAGEKFFSAVLFDGTDAGGPVEVGAFIGKKAAAEEIKSIAGENRNIDITLLPPDAWHIRMAVFPVKDAGESAPAYEMEEILHDNGVVSYARVIYKTFSVEERLEALSQLPPRKCS